MASITGLISALPGDIGSAIAAAIRERIAELSKAIESPDLAERETALIRGGIRELRSLLADRPPHVSPLRYSGHQRGNA